MKKNQKEQEREERRTEGMNTTAETAIWINNFNFFNKLDPWGQLYFHNFSDLNFNIIK